MTLRTVAKRLIRLVADRSGQRSFAEGTPQHLPERRYVSLGHQHAGGCKLKGLRAELTTFCGMQETESQFRSAQAHRFFTLSNLR